MIAVIGSIRKLDDVDYCCGRFFVKVENDGSSINLTLLIALWTMYFNCCYEHPFWSFFVYTMSVGRK